jgi:hypothetical protein
MEFKDTFSDPDSRVSGPDSRQDWWWTSCSPYTGVGIPS